MTISKRLIFSALICVFVTSSLWAQAGRGQARISGVVLDENNEGIPSVRIVCEFTENPEVKEVTTTNKKGEWAILGLGTGMWKVTASKEGYIPVSTEIYVQQLKKNPKIKLTLKSMDSKELDADLSSANLLEKAEAQFNDENYEEALSFLQQFLDENPEAYQIYDSMGDCYREMGEFDSAIENYQKVLEKAKADKEDQREIISSALAGIGECYLKMEDYEKAQDYFEQSLEAYPDNEVLAYNVGEIYFSQNEIDQAIKYFTVATEIKPDWSPPYLKLGYVNLNKGDFESAEVNFKKFLELEPDSPDAPTVKNILEFLAEKKINIPILCFL
ncbi:MAG: tetratricopeptide repeat protein [Acidobacteriota bacterium]